MKRIVQFILSTALMMSVTSCANSSKTYNIKFVNEDETVLQEMTVKRGVVPEYTGETPKKIQNAEYTYTFSGWTASSGTIASISLCIAMYKARSL